MKQNVNDVRGYSRGRSNVAGSIVEGFMEHKEVINLIG